MKRKSCPKGGALLARDVVERFLAFQSDMAERGKLSHAYLNLLRAALRQQSGGRFVSYLDLFGDRVVDNLRQSDLTEWITANPQWLAPDTRQNNLTHVIACFNWAVEEELVQHCPYRKTHRLREERRTRRDATDEEAARIFEAAPEPLRRIMRFVDQTGARTCEARELRWSQIQWDRCVAILEEHKTRRKQKEPRPRIIALNENIILELRAWFDAKPVHEERVFLTLRGRAWTRCNLTNEFQKLRKKLGLAKDLTPYCFRHRFATQGILAGIPERAVGDLMGHEGPEMIRRYTHTSRAVDHLRDRADELSVLRAARMPKCPKKAKATEPPPAAAMLESSPSDVFSPTPCRAPTPPASATMFFFGFTSSPEASRNGSTPS